MAQRNGTLVRVKPIGRQTCSVGGCSAFVKGHGLCALHYFRSTRHGSVADPRASASDRFWPNVDRSGGPNACWEWTAHRNWMGYGVFWFDHRGWPAHRWAYHDRVAPVSPGIELDHLCRNRACVNPAHLEPVSGRENKLRGYGAAAENARKTHCIHGHPFDAANTHPLKGGGRRCGACAGLRPNPV